MVFGGAPRSPGDVVLQIDTRAVRALGPDSVRLGSEAESDQLHVSLSWAVVT